MDYILFTTMLLIINLLFLFAMVKRSENTDSYCLEDIKKTVMDLKRIEQDDTEIQKINKRLDDLTSRLDDTMKFIKLLEETFDKIEK